MRKVFFILLTIPLWVACSSEDNVVSQNDNATKVMLSAEEFMSVTNDHIKELSETDILNIVQDYQTIEFENTTTRSSANNLIVGKYYIGNDGSKTLTRSALVIDSISLPIYEVACNNGKGVAYVTADTRHSEVIAYIPQKTDNEQAAESRNLMLSISEESALNTVRKIEKHKKNLRNKTLEKISKKLFVDVADINLDLILNSVTVENSGTTSRATPVNAPSGVCVARMSPKAFAKWGQYHPYDYKLPVAPGFEGWDNAPNIPVGCVNVAIATALSVIKPTMYCNGTFIDWAYLLKRPRVIGPDSYTYTFDQDDTVLYNYGVADNQDKLNMIGELMKLIYTETESYTTFNPNMMFDRGTTGTLYTKVVPFLRKHVACDDMIYGLNTEEVYNSIKAGRISLIGGNTLGKSNGHLWLVDGCSIHQKSSTRAALVQQYNVYFHCNMGWEGDSNGYYLINSDMTMTFDTTQYSYNANFRYIANIKAK